MGDDVYLGTELLGKFVCYSYSEYYKEVMVDVLIESGKDREANQGGRFAKYVSKTPQKPKRWRAQRGENYWFFDRTYTPYQQEESGDIEDEIMYDSYNYFRTKDEAHQAAEAVRETLMKFHEQNQKYNGEKEI